MSKPLMSPEPKRRDRRSGWRSERLREALRQPTGQRRGRRSPSEKHDALGRLLGRYLGRSRSTLFTILLSVATVGGAWGTWRAMADSHHLVPFGDARVAYDRLAAAASAACEADVCAWGWHSANRPPSEVAHWMARVRARAVRFDQTGGRTSVWPGYPRGPHLLRVAGIDEANARLGQGAVSPDSRGGERWPVPQGAPLGSGWYRVPG